jgi:hypothetical protein
MSAEAIHAGHEIRFDEWVAVMQDTGNFHYFHDHDIATGNNLTPWEWAKDGCEGCGRPIPRALVMICELQKLAFKKDEEEDLGGFTFPVKP